MSKCLQTHGSSQLIFFVQAWLVTSAKELEQKGTELGNGNEAQIFSVVKSGLKLWTNLISIPWYGDKSLDWQIFNGT